MRHANLLPLAVAVWIVVCDPGFHAARPDDKPKKKRPTLNELVVLGCQQNLGKKVGDGECAGLAELALKDVGARPRGKDSPAKDDYVWGKLVATIEAGKPLPDLAGVKPGDVIQLRDVAHTYDRPGVKGRRSYPHHTAIVRGVAGDVVQVWHQNVAGVRLVVEDEIDLAGLEKGWLRVYRPQPR